MVRIFGSRSSRRRVKKDCCQRNGQQGTYDDLMQFRCLGTWVKGAKTTKTQKPDSFLSNTNSQMCTKSSKRLPAPCKRQSKIKASVSKNETSCSALTFADLPGWVKIVPIWSKVLSATFSCLPFSKRNKQTIAIFRSQLHIEYIISFILWNRVRIWMFPSYLFRRWTLLKEIDF